MSESTKAVLSTVTIVACLTLIGVLTYLKVEGAGIAAVSTVGVIIAWLTRTPDRKDPPIAPKLIPLIAAGTLLASILACGCSSPQLPEPTIEQKKTAAKTTFAKQLNDCVEDNNDDYSIEMCFRDTFARWGKDGGKFQ